MSPRPLYSLGYVLRSLEWLCKPVAGLQTHKSLCQIGQHKTGFKESGDPREACVEVGYCPGKTTYVSITDYFGYSITLRDSIVQRAEIVLHSRVSGLCSSILLSSDPRLPSMLRSGWG